MKDEKSMLKPTTATVPAVIGSSFILPPSSFTNLPLCWYRASLDRISPVRGCLPLVWSFLFPQISQMESAGCYVLTLFDEAEPEKLQTNIKVFISGYLTNGLTSTSKGN